MPSPTIVNIRVGQKFTIGETLFFVDSGFVEPVTILSKPYWAPYIPGHHHGAWRIRVLTEQGKERTPSLGDMGINGYRYDARPAKMARSGLLACIALASYNQWEDAQNFKHCGREFF